MTYELDVINTEYIEHDEGTILPDPVRDGNPLPVDVNTILKGKLHLRMANIGHPADHKLTRAGTLHPSKLTKDYCSLQLNSNAVHTDFPLYFLA